MDDRARYLADRRRGKAEMVVQWRWVSLFLAVVAISAVGALAVTSTTKGVDDALAIVALALAVLSFTAQLIVVMVQSFQSWQVNSETKTALADVRATVASVLSNQKDQFDKVLDYVIKNALPAAVRDVGEESVRSGDDPTVTDNLVEEIGERLSRRLEELAGPLPMDREVGRLASSRFDYSQARESELQSSLRTFPSEELGLPIYERLKNLGIDGAVALGKVASQVQRTWRTDRTVRFNRSSDGPQPGFVKLVDEGFLELIDERSDDRMATLRITDSGWIALRLVTARGERPPYLRERE